MKQNKIFYLVAFLAAGVAVPSCTDAFLEEEMVATITQDYFNTEQGMDELLTGTYDAFRQNLQYNQGPETFLYGVDTWTANGATTSGYSPSVWSATGGPANNMDGLCAEDSRSMLGWYPTINNCNRAIQTIDEGKGLGKYAPGRPEAARAKAEALFNRAYSIWQINTMLGDVYFPRTYTQAMPENFAFSRESSESIYHQLISDLKFSFENLPETVPDAEYGRATKAAAAHFLAKLYLMRYLGKDYGTAEYGRNADGTIDNSNPKSYLGMLYKGTGTADLDSVIYYCNYVTARHTLATTYSEIFRHEKGDFSNEGISEVVFAAVFGTPSGDGNNGRYANRLQYFLGPNYMVAQWGLPSEVWASYRGRSNVGAANDFALDLYADKTIDSRFQGSFWVEMEAMNGASPYYAYDDAGNATYKWTDYQADYFNANILPHYDRESWNGRRAVKDEHKIGTGDLAFAFLENTKETAIDSLEAVSQPFYLVARWIKSADGKYFYRPTRGTKGEYHYQNITAHGGLTSMTGEISLRTRKYSDPDRASLTDVNSSRDVPIFRVAEAHLMRAYANGLKGDYGAALVDINAVRERAAYHTGETRAEVIARLYPGAENLPDGDRSYPYTVSVDNKAKMDVTAASWDGMSAESKAEMYPEINIAGGSLSEADRFQNFILNEIAREFNQEFVYYGWLHHSGWQYARILYHNKEASTLAQGPDYWPVADNEVSDGSLTDRKGLGFLQPYHTLKPFKQATIDLFTDENGVLLDAAGRKAYQNYGY